MEYRSGAIGSLIFVVCALSGCAALSLFSSTHHHNHVSPELEQRLQVVEERAAMLESRLAALEGIPVEHSFPVLPVPSP